MAGDAIDRTVQPRLSQGAWLIVRASLSTVMILTLGHLVGAAFAVELRRHEMGDYLQRLYLASHGAPGPVVRVQPAADQPLGERGRPGEPAAAPGPDPDKPAGLTRSAPLRES
ncbi:MAG: hypothetical protein KC442_06330 [Thermomicrobiales bacterium]|nr:hypothetical protein [Thermomicrobiales bacterium]